MIFHWYGFFIGLAGVVGYSIAEHLEPKVAKVAPWILLFGFVGARLYHIVDLWSYYSQNLGQIVAVWNGGMSIWGGLIGGFVAWWIVDRRSWETLGAMATALPLSQAIGRIGNGVNGEFVNKIWILPWWSVEAILDIILFGIMWYLKPRGRTPRTAIWVYLVGYGLIRLVLQPYRL